MKKDNVTILHAEYPSFRNDDNDHVILTALGVMYYDFTNNEKYYNMEARRHHEILKLFTDISELLQKERNSYSRFASDTMIEIDRIQSMCPLIEKLFYETEYQVNISIAPLKCLSSSEQHSLQMIEHFQRFNKTTQQKRDEQIGKIIDSD